MEEQKFCIVGTGRSGSSLLAQLLAASGADFGMTPASEWNTQKGSLEHPACHEAVKYFQRIEQLERSIVPNWPLSDHYKARLHSEMERLRSVQFFKSTELFTIVPNLHSFFKGALRVIHIYRDFATYAASRHRKSGWEYERLVAAYVNSNATSLLQVSLYGGIVISFNELRDVTAEGWVKPLCALTGLQTETILEQRRFLMKDLPSNTADTKFTFVPLQVRELEQRMEECKNVVITK